MGKLILYLIIMCLIAAWTMVVAEQSGLLINTLMQQAIDIFP